MNHPSKAETELFLTSTRQDLRQLYGVRDADAEIIALFKAKEFGRLSIDKPSRMSAPARAVLKTVGAHDLLDKPAPSAREAETAIERLLGRRPDLMRPFQNLIDRLRSDQQLPDGYYAWEKTSLQESADLASSLKLLVDHPPTTDDRAPGVSREGVLIVVGDGESSRGPGIAARGVHDGVRPQTLPSPAGLAAAVTAAAVSVIAGGLGAAINQNLVFDWLWLTWAVMGVVSMLLLFLAASRRRRYISLVLSRGLDLLANDSNQVDEVIDDLIRAGANREAAQLLARRDQAVST